MSDACPAVTITKTHSLEDNAVNEEAQSLLRKHGKGQSVAAEDLLSPTFMAFAMAVFAIKGFNTSFASMATSYFQKDHLHWSPAAATMFPVIMMMAWNVKPLLGFVSDGFPIAGYHRVSYIVIAMVVVSVAWLVLTMGIQNTYAYVAIQTLINTSICMAFVCGQAIVAERSQGQKVGDSNKLQTWIWGSSMVGGLLGGTLGGQLQANVGHSSVFALSAVAPIIALPFMWAPSLERKRTAAQDRSVSEMGQELCKVFSQWRMMAPALYIFLNCLTPGMGSSSFYYYSNHLKISQEWMAILGTVDSIAGLCGMAIYYAFFTGYGPRFMMFWGNIVITLIVSTQLLLYTGYNRVVGIPDVAFLFLDDIIIVTTGQVLMVPLLSMMAMLCPKGMEGTVFCLYTALNNLGGNLSSMISAGLVAAFGITAHNFDNMVPLRLATLCLQLLPCLLVGLLPTDEEIVSLLDDANAHSTEPDGTDEEGQAVGAVAGAVEDSTVKVKDKASSTPGGPDEHHLAKNDVP